MPDKESLKKSVVKICGIDSQKGIDPEKGIIPFVLTERVVDRDSEVIEPNGGILENYIKNPVFLWAHDIRSPSIGRVIPETLKQTKQRLSGDVQFDMDDPFARLIFNKYVKGFLNAGSIRFMPIDWSEEQVLEGQKRGTFKKWELLEFSAVPVPANPAALAQKGFDDGLDEIERGKKWLEELKSFMEDDNFDHTPEGWVERKNLIGEDEKKIRGGEWHQFCKDLGFMDPNDVNLEFDSIEQMEELEKLFDETEPWDPQKPYPNEHACRVHPPENYVRIRRQSRKHDGKEYFVLIGFKQGGGSEDQAYRYPKATWTEAQARAHCRSHNGQSFEPAKKEKEFVEYNSITYRVEFDDELGKYILIPDEEETDIGEDSIEEEQPELEEDSAKAGRILSSKNRKLIKQIIADFEVLLQADDGKDFDELEDEDKSVVPFRSYSLADEGRAWDASAATSRIRKWASSDGSGNKDKVSWNKYRSAFTWYDSADSENFGAYKLPHHDAEDGKLVTIWRGVATAMIALLGGRGGVNVPDSERRGIYNHLSRHYREFSKDPPEFKEIDEAAEDGKVSWESLPEELDEAEAKELLPLIVDEVIKQMKEKKNVE